MQLDFGGTDEACFFLTESANGIQVRAAGDRSTRPPSLQEGSELLVVQRLGWQRAPGLAAGPFRCPGTMSILPTWFIGS